MIPQKKLTRGDLAVYAVVIVMFVLSLILPNCVYASSDNEDQVLGKKIYFSVIADKEKLIIDAIDGEYNLTSGGIEYTLTVSDGAISVTESGCPDHFCEISSRQAGGINKPGENIVCVPGKLVITVVDENKVKIPNSTSEERDEDFTVG